MFKDVCYVPLREIKLFDPSSQPLRLPSKDRIPHSGNTGIKLSHYSLLNKVFKSCGQAHNRTTSEWFY